MAKLIQDTCKEILVTNGLIQNSSSDQNSKSSESNNNSEHSDSDKETKEQAKQKSPEVQIPIANQPNHNAANMYPQQPIFNDPMPQTEYSHNAYKREFTQASNFPATSAIWFPGATGNNMSVAEWRVGNHVIGPIPGERQDEMSTLINNTSLDDAIKTMQNRYLSTFQKIQSNFIETTKAKEFYIREYGDKKITNIGEACIKAKINDGQILQIINATIEKVTDKTLLQGQRQDSNLVRIILANLSNPTPMQVFVAVLKARRIIDQHWSWIGGRQNATDTEDAISTLPDIMNSLIATNWRAAIPTKWAELLLHITPAPYLVLEHQHQWAIDNYPQELSTHLEVNLQSIIAQATLATMTTKILTTSSNTAQRAVFAQHVLTSSNHFSGEVNRQMGAVLSGASLVLEVLTPENKLFCKVVQPKQLDAIIQNRNKTFINTPGVLSQPVAHLGLPAIYNGKPTTVANISYDMRRNQYHIIKENQLHVDTDLSNIEGTIFIKQMQTTNIISQLIGKNFYNKQQLQTALTPRLEIIHNIRSSNHCQSSQCNKNNIHNSANIYKCSCCCTLPMLTYSFPVCLNVEEILYSVDTNNPRYVEPAYGAKNISNYELNIMMLGSTENTRCWPNYTNITHVLPPKPLKIPLFSLNNYQRLKQYTVCNDTLFIASRATNYSSTSVTSCEKWLIEPTLQRANAESEINWRYYTACWGQLPTNRQAQRLYIANPALIIQGQNSCVELVPYILQYLAQDLQIDPHKLSISEATINCPLCIEETLLREYHNHYTKCHNEADVVVAVADVTGLGMRAAQALMLANIVQTIRWQSRYPQSPENRAITNSYKEKAEKYKQKNEEFANTITTLEQQLKSKQQEVYQLTIELQQLKQQREHKQPHPTTQESSEGYQPPPKKYFKLN